MKILLRKFIGAINILFIRLKRHISIKDCSFFLVKISIENNNKIDLNSTVLEESKLFVQGTNNKIEFTKSLLSKSHISIMGNNNQIICDSNVKLRGANIQMRGENCTLKIGNGSSFGGIRIVNVGTNNDITIGEDCLFADHIELWASDTHSIFDENNQMINPEKSVIIGDRVWVGSHVKILKGITIGNNSIIGMGSLVTKDIMAGTLNAGMPSKLLKKNVSWKLNY